MLQTLVVERFITKYCWLVDKCNSISLCISIWGPIPPHYFRYDKWHVTGDNHVTLIVSTDRGLPRSTRAVTTLHTHANQLNAGYNVFNGYFSDPFSLPQIEFYENCVLETKVSFCQKIFKMQSWHFPLLFIDIRQTFMLFRLF